MMTTDLGPPELLESDRAGVTPGSGQVGQHNHDESIGGCVGSAATLRNPTVTQAPG